MYYVYMIRCRDNSIYTGITTDVKRRINEHFKQNEKCAKYTLNHPIEKLECAWETENRVLASKLEYYIKKRLTKKQKEELIIKNNLEELLNEKIEVGKYKKYEIGGIKNDIS